MPFIKLKDKPLHFMTRKDMDKIQPEIDKRTAADKASAEAMKKALKEKNGD